MDYSKMTKAQLINELRKKDGCRFSRYKNVDFTCKCNEDCDNCDYYAPLDDKGNCALRNDLESQAFEAFNCTGECDECVYGRRSGGRKCEKPEVAKVLKM